MRRENWLKLCSTRRCFSFLTEIQQELRYIISEDVNVGEGYIEDRQRRFRLGGEFMAAELAAASLI